MNHFNLEIVTPLRNIQIEDVSYVRCPGLDGSFGIMPKHQEGIFALSVGEIKVIINGKKDYYSIGGGFAEVIENKMKVLVESLESSSEIDPNRPKNAIERAKKRKSEKKSNHDGNRIETSLLRALNRLRVSKR